MKWGDCHPVRQRAMAPGKRTLQRLFIVLNISFVQLNFQLQIAALLRGYLHTRGCRPGQWLWPYAYAAYGWMFFQCTTTYGEAVTTGLVSALDPSTLRCTSPH